MKVELDLTKEQYDLLLSLVFSKFDELDRQEDSLLVCRDFSDIPEEMEEYNKQLKELEKPLEDAKTLYKQIAVYTMPWLA